MKLHLPKQLFSALLSAITLAAAPLALTLGSNAWGDIYTITGLGTKDGSISQDTAYAKYVLTTKDAEGNYVYGDTVIGPNNWSGIKPNAWSTVEACNIIRLIQTDDIQDKALIYTFDAWEVGGLIVEADGYSITGGAGSYEKRKFDLNKGDYIINGDFGINTKDTNLNFAETQVWDIASTKQLRLDTTKAIVIGGDYGSIDPVVASVTINNGSTIFNANTEIKNGSTLIADKQAIVTFNKSLTNNGSITIQNGATLTLNKNSSITNNGTMVLGGAITVEGAELSAEIPTVSNGYEQVTGDLSKLTGSGSYVAATGLTINGIKVAKLSNVGGSVTAYLGTYHVINGTADYNTGDTSLDISSDATLAIVLNGGNLNMLSSLNEKAIDGGIQVKQNATITLGYKEAMLDSSSLQIDSGAAVVLAGSGIYNLESGHDLGNNISLAADWAGTVQVTGDFDDLSASIEDLDTTSAAKVRLHGVQGWLKAATDAANLANSAEYTLSADIELINKGSTSAWKIDDGYSINADASNKDRYAIISGNISGTGDIEFNADVSPQYNLTGDISQWEGNLKVMKNPLVIVLQGNATTVNAGMLAGQGTSGAGTLNLVVDNSGKLTSFNNVVRVSSLELTEGSQTGFNYSDEANSIGLLTAGSGAVSVGENVSLTLGGGTADTRKDHAIGTLSSGAGAGISLGDYATIALGAGTAEKQKEHEIGIISTGNSAGISLGDYATLKVTDIPGALETSYSDGGNVDKASSLNIAISGGIGSVLDLVLDDVESLTGDDNWKRNSTVTLTQSEGSKLAVRVSSGYLANCVFGANNNVAYGSCATTNLGGSNLSMADGTHLVLRKGHAAENFGAGDITLEEGTVGLDLYGSVSAENTALTNNISGDTLRVWNTGGVSMTGTLNLNALQVEAGKVSLGGGTSKKLQSLSVNKDKVLEVAAGTRLEMVDAQKATKVSISSTDGTSAAKLTAKTDNALLQLQADTSFSISDMTLSGVKISADAGTEVVLRGVDTTGGVELAAGQFTMADTVSLSEQEPAAKSGGYTASFSSDQLSGITLNNAGGAATLTVDLGSLPGSLTMGQTYDMLTITLYGFTMDYTSGEGLIFAEGSWLAQMLGKEANKGATVSIKALDEAAVATQEAAVASTNAVTYNSAPGSNVGTVICITGLSVIPEPATTTLGLVALAALVTRRRRK